MCTWYRNVGHIVLLWGHCLLYPVVCHWKWGSIFSTDKTIFVLGKSSVTQNLMSKLWILPHGFYLYHRIHQYMCPSVYLDKTLVSAVSCLHITWHTDSGVCHQVTYLPVGLSRSGYIPAPPSHSSSYSSGNKNQLEPALLIWISNCRIFDSYENEKTMSRKSCYEL